jgi:hypothetical protein
MKLKTLLFGAVAGLLLTACGGGSSPEDVTRSFVEALAAGECDKAMDMAVESAKETVQGTIDAGCEAYGTEIVSVSCETTEETAACTCAEKRDGMDMSYNYDLKSVDGTWKVAGYSKDMGDMSDMNFGG